MKERIHINFGRGVKPIDMEVKYHVITGYVEHEPKLLDFEDDLFGKTLTKEISLFANSSHKLTIKGVKTNDRRLWASVDGQTDNFSWIKVNFDPTMTTVTDETAKYHDLTRFYQLEAKQTDPKKPKALKLSSGINRKINDDIANRENKDRVKDRFMFEYFKQTGPAEFRVNVKLPDNREVEWLHQHIMFPTEQMVLGDYIHASANEFYLRTLDEPKTSRQLSSNIYGTLSNEFKFGVNLSHRDFLVEMDMRKRWNELTRNGDHYVNSSIVVDTVEAGEIRVPVFGQLKRPQLTISKSINFGTVQIGSSHYGDLVIENPTDDFIQAELSIGYDLEHEDMKLAVEDVDRVDAITARVTMERLMNLFMVGIDFTHIDQIDGLFENFRVKDTTPLQEVDSYTSLADGNKTIVEMLLNFGEEHEFNQVAFEASKEDHTETLLSHDYATYKELSDLLPYYIEETAESDEKLLKEIKESRKIKAEQTLDDVLKYYEWYRAINQHNFVSKYCSRLFQEHSATWPYDDLDTILSTTKADKQNLLTDRKDPVRQCVHVIKKIHLMQKNRKQGGCTNDDFLIETI